MLLLTYSYTSLAHKTDINSFVLLQYYGIYRKKKLQPTTNFRLTNPLSEDRPISIKFYPVFHTKYRRHDLRLVKGA